MSTENSTADDELYRQAVDVEHDAPRLSLHISMAAGVVAALTSAPFAILSMPFGLAGLGMLAAGLYVAEERMWVSVGAAGIFSGIILAGVLGGLTVELVLLSVISLMVAWDVGQNALSIGEHLTTATHVRRLQLVHAGMTAVVATMAGGLAYGVYVTMSGSGAIPVPALGGLLIGAVVLMWAIRR